MADDCKKILKKVGLLFHSNPVPYNGQDYEKQIGPVTSDQSPFIVQNKFNKFIIEHWLLID